MFVEFLRLAGQSIAHRRLRSWLTVIGVFIGITAVVALMTIGYSLEKTINSQISGVFGTDSFVIFGGDVFGRGGPHGGDAEGYALDLEALKSLDGVSAVAAVRRRNGFVQGKPKADGTALQGILPVRGLSYELVTEFESFVGELGVQEGGRLFDPDETSVTVLGADIAERLGVRVGGTILVAGDGSNELDLEVVGILLPSDDDPANDSFVSGMSQTDEDDTINVPYDTMDLLWGPAEDVQYTLVKAATGYNVDEVAGRAEEALAERGSEISTLTYTDLSDFVGSMTAAISGFLAGIAGISLLVGGVGVMNTMFTSVLERTKEIGVMKAVGAKNSHVLSIFLIESGLMGLVGGIVGSALGVGLSLVGVSLIDRFTTGFDMVWGIDPLLIVYTLVGSFALGAFAGLWPARRASKLPVVDALRYE